ncbi:hypothetical protein EPUS_00213 [Endocarpon pusillum Z07020]|uniref:FAS1 domain-containing protein n=1 Tax=Endocarpon pusillum (strain Z07020 / HMAS-L-300199) TaxID=1263415 RepID=U1HX78_ENDPU|nr:uncharacterized protein EPUS_00213 [Endocarpon pusillum Z07020]ERF75420.1 hypothetical protein EPUS_00213 [Endocarpon pusillum Z07020]
MQIKKLLPLALATAASAQETMNLTAALASSPELSQLGITLGLVPELVAALAELSNITLLAPSNAAFEEFTNSSNAAALSDPGLIQAVLQYHVLNGTYYAQNVTETTSFIPTTLMNTSYTNVTGGQVVKAVLTGDNVVFSSGLLTNSTVTQADVTFDSGVIHIIDRLLTVPANVSTTAVAANLTSLVGAVTTAELAEAVDTTPNVTIFAPTNEAFQSIGSALGSISTEDLASILTYHVVSGTVGYSSILSNTTLTTLNDADVTISIVDGAVFVNSARVVMADVLVANGVVHVIDNVLNPANATATPDATMSTQMPAFSGASSASEVPYTSNVPTPTGPAATGGAAGGSETSSSASGAAMPMRTGAVGAAALFGGAALVYNM